MLTYALMGFGFLAVISVWFFVKNRKQKDDKVSLVPASLPSSRNGHRPEEDTGDPIIDNLVELPARVYDNFTRSVKNEDLKAGAVRQIRKDYGNVGRRWFRDGQWRYAVVRLATGTYIPVDHYMSLSLKNPPERLHRALQQQETTTFYRPHDNRGTLAKYGAYLLFAGAVIVILFLWGATMLKGT
jgi:hypothetical protein